MILYRGLALRKNVLFQLRHEYFGVLILFWLEILGNHNIAMKSKMLAYHSFGTFPCLSSPNQTLSHSIEGTAPRHRETKFWDRTEVLLQICNISID